MAQAKRLIENRRIEHNRERLHSSLDDLTPEEFAARALAMPKKSVSLTVDSIPAPY